MGDTKKQPVLTPPKEFKDENWAEKIKLARSIRAKVRARKKVKPAGQPENRHWLAEN